MQQFGRDRVESGHRADMVDWSRLTRSGHFWLLCKSSQQKANKGKDRQQSIFALGDCASLVPNGSERPLPPTALPPLPQKDLSTVKAKVSADLNALKTDVQRAKHKLDVKVAKKRAEALEWEASFAIDYAIASIEQAKFAVLDAIDARQVSEQAKRAPAA